MQSSFRTEQTFSKFETKTKIQTKNTKIGDSETAVVSFCTYYKSDIL